MGMHLLTLYCSFFTVVGQNEVMQNQSKLLMFSFPLPWPIFLQLEGLASQSARGAESILLLPRLLQVLPSHLGA